MEHFCTRLGCRGCSQGLLGQQSALAQQGLSAMQGQLGPPTAFEDGVRLSPIQVENEQLKKQVGDLANRLSRLSSRQPRGAMPELDAARDDLLKLKERLTMVERRWAIYSDKLGDTCRERDQLAVEVTRLQRDNDGLRRKLGAKR